MRNSKRLRVKARNFSFFLLVLLAVEFLDELVYGAREAAWPLMRAELGITYLQVGLLLSLPTYSGLLVESAVGVLADRGWRRALVLAGGAAFGLALVLVGTSGSVVGLLIAFALLSPASGAFVGLSQASLMDADPTRREQNMARWTLAGSMGVVAGPLALGAATALGPGWRGLFLGFAALAAALLVVVWPLRGVGTVTGEARRASPIRRSFQAGLVEALGALRRPVVLRWLALLAFSDLMLDVLFGYLALYFVDIALATPVQAALGVAVWTGFGLLGDAALIPVLDRVAGLTYLRVSAALELILFPAFLLAPAFPAKLVILGLLGFFNAGWYSILKAHLYGAMPGQSGRVMTVGNLFNLGGGLIPLGLGWLAGRYNLEVALWLLLAGPLALILGLPRGGDQEALG